MFSFPNFVQPSTYKSVISDIPTLIISGQLDPVLPPETGAAISKYLANSQHIVIPYMGHIFSELSNLDCYDTYVVSFFEGQEGSFEKRCFDKMKPNPFKLRPQRIQCIGQNSGAEKVDIAITEEPSKFISMTR